MRLTLHNSVLGKPNSFKCIFVHFETSCILGGKINKLKHSLALYIRLEWRRIMTIFAKRRSRVPSQIRVFAISN